MRTLAALIAIVLSTAYATRALFAVDAAWGAPVGVLVAAGGFLLAAVLLRSAPRSPVRRRKRALPRDPGLPREPLGAPYRGPR